MVSGYFAYSDSWSYKRILKKLFRILKMALVSVAVYILYNIIMNGFASVVSEVSVMNVIKLLVFNAPQISSAHLWFLFALIYCYLLLIATRRLLNASLMKIYIVVALALHVLIAEIIPEVGVTTFAHPVVRNAYLFGYPFFLIGYYIRKNRACIDEMKKFELTIATIFGAALALFEHTYIISNDLPELYVGSIVMSVAIFIFSIKINSTQSTILSHIGRDYSMIIYIVHPMIGGLISWIVMGVLGNEISKPMQWILPILISCGTLLLAHVYYILTGEIKEI